MYQVTSSLYHLGAFCIALVLCIIGVLIAEEIRKARRRHKARKVQPDQSDRTNVIRTRLKFRQDNDDNYAENEEEITRRHAQQDKDTHEWALNNPNDPVARRYLKETRDDMTGKMVYLEYSRVPAPPGSEGMVFSQARHDQDLAKLNALQAKVDRIDAALATLSGKP